jgi:hypothetical protein
MLPEFSAEPSSLSRVLSELELELEELLLEVELVELVELELLVLVVELESFVPSSFSRSLKADLALERSPELIELNRFSMSWPSSFSVADESEEDEAAVPLSGVSFSNVVSAVCAEEMSLFDNDESTLEIKVPTGSLSVVELGESFFTSFR